MAQAVAYLFGAGNVPSITGMVRFSDMQDGYTKVDIDVKGLTGQVHGFHIHEKGSCQDRSDPEDAFASAGPHYNPSGAHHGYHAGDLPPLIASEGRAKMTFYTKKFSVSEIIGRSVIVHEKPDDFRTDPGGASGKRIACGIIRRVIEGKKSYEKSGQ